MKKNLYVTNFFLFLFLLLYFCAFTFLMIFSAAAPLTTRIIYAAASFFQILLLTSSFALMITWIEKNCSKKNLLTVVTGLFIFTVLFFIQFILIQVTDATVLSVFSMIFGGGIKQFFVFFRAVNLSRFTLMLILTSAISLPFLGIGSYRLFEKFSKKFPYRFPIASAIALIFISIFSLLTLDRITQTKKNFYHHHLFQKRTPLPLCFFTPQPQKVNISSMPSSDNVSSIEKLPFIEEKPNIFLFVIETFRKDAVSPQTAPSLYAMQKQGYCPTYTYASSNASHISWYSIFHSKYPLGWNKEQNGSLPLQLLKEAGYTIHVLSSAELSFFEMDKKLFGKDHQLVDEFVEFSSVLYPQAHKRDLQGFSILQKRLQQKGYEKGHLFIVFLDSPHSEYSFEKDYPYQITPQVKHLNYVKSSFTSKDLPLIKNRYLTSIHFLDHQFQKLFEKLKEQHLYDSSLIIITGDHGEEFFEEKALFHGSHLNKYQLSIPIIFKLPKAPNGRLQPQCSQCDIFPTIFDTLFHTSVPVLDGQSIFSSSKWPVHIAISRNSGLDHVELSLICRDRFFSGMINHFTGRPHIDFLYFQIDDKKNFEFRPQDFQKNFTFPLNKVIDHFFFSEEPSDVKN